MIPLILIKNKTKEEIIDIIEISFEFILNLIFNSNEDILIQSSILYLRSIIHISKDLLLDFKFSYNNFVNHHPIDIIINLSLKLLGIYFIKKKKILKKKYKKKGKI
jgi:hypothetical protein